MPAGVSAYTPLANVTLGSSASSVTFSSISQAYRDLVFVIYTKSSNSSAVWAQFNDDSGNNYAYLYMRGSGSTSSYGENPVGTGGRVIIDTTSFSNSIMQIMDYSTTDKNKYYLVRNNIATTAVDAVAGRWASTSAVTKIKFMTLYNAYTLEAGTRIELYGIAA